MDRQDGQDEDKNGKEKSCISCSSMLNALIEHGMCLLVAKEKIAENGEYNLSVERYRENDIHSSDFPIMPLGELAMIIAGQSPPGNSYNENGNGTPFYQGKTEFGKMSIGEPKKMDHRSAKACRTKGHSHVGAGTCWPCQHSNAEYMHWPRPCRNQTKQRLFAAPLRFLPFAQLGGRNCWRRRGSLCVNQPPRC